MLFVAIVWAMLFACLYYTFKFICYIFGWDGIFDIPAWFWWALLITPTSTVALFASLVSINEMKIFDKFK